jgi:imidazolonepropionase-like amidohydrolase
LVTYTAIAEEGRAEGMGPSSHAKVFDVLDAGMRGLELAHRGGVNVVFGTDLLGGMQRLQLTEVRLRAEVQPAADVIRSATTVAARLLDAEGVTGLIEPGTRADLLAVDGDPLADIGLLCEPERSHRLLMANGVAVQLPC